MPKILGTRLTIKNVFKVIFFFIVSGLITMLLETEFYAYYYSYKTQKRIGIINCPPFIKKELRKNIELQAFLTDRFGDTIYDYTCARMNAMMIWRLNKYDSIFIPSVKLTIRKDYDLPKFESTAFENIGANKYGISARSRINEAANLKMEIDKYASVDTSIDAPSYNYYYLRYENLAFYSDEGIDILLQNGTCMHKSDFMICKYNHSFYMIFLYSRDNSDVGRDVLLNMINLSRS
jgi:hypothetical protein